MVKKVHVRAHLPAFLPGYYAEGLRVDSVGAANSFLDEAREEDFLFGLSEDELEGVCARGRGERGEVPADFEGGGGHGAQLGGDSEDTVEWSVDEGLDDFGGDARNYPLHIVSFYSI